MNSAHIGTRGHAFVRICQTPLCKGAAPFESHVRHCGSCGRRRAEACASVAIDGASAEEWLMIQDLLDAEFNSQIFVGRLSGRVSKVGKNLWIIDQAQLHMPGGFKTRVDSGHSLLTAALERGGLNILDPIAAPAPAVSQWAVAAL